MCDSLFVFGFSWCFSFVASMKYGGNENGLETDGERNLSTVKDET